MNRALAAACFFAAAAVSAWFLARGGDGPAGPRSGSETAGQAPTARRRGEDAAAAPRAGEAPRAGDAPSPTPASAEKSAFDDLRAALAAGGTEEGPRAAAALRHALRTDPAARREAEALLVAADTPTALRQALALVLGTIATPDPDTLLLDAMSRFPDDAAFARACLLALGATREPEDDDDVFGLGDRPWGRIGPAGIGITVKREIGDARTRARVVECLVRSDARVRVAAAIALRHTTSEVDVRAAFRNALQGERDDGVAQQLGEALTQAVGASEDAAEREQTLSLVLARAGEESLVGMRFCVEDDLSQARLDAPHVERLRSFAQTTSPLAQRTFALTVLANAAKRGSSVAPDVARPLLVAGLGDTHTPLRHLSARLLGGLPLDADTSAALAKTAKDDEAWNVRWIALGSLAAKADPAVARAALETARGDADHRVASRAAELLAGLTGR